MKAFFLAACFVMSSFAFAAPETGKPAPDFSAKGADGKTYSLKEFKGKIVVLEWFNKDCPYVKKFYDSKKMQKIQKEAADQGVVWLTISSSRKGKEGFLDEKSGTAVRSDKGMSNTALLLDAGGDVARLYSAKTTPHMFVIDKTGLLAYQGAIDDQPSANPKSLEKAKNYVEAALRSLENGQPVAEGATSPYGCSVKY